MTPTSPRPARHHAAQRGGRPVVLVAMVLTLLLGGMIQPALAKGPSSKQIDEAMLRLPGSDLARVTEAEANLREARALSDATSRDLDIARKDTTAAKAWVDASNSVLKAIGLDRRASEDAARTSQLERLATEQVRSESSLRWRKSRWEAAKTRITYVQTKIAWIKAELTRLDIALTEAKLVTYKASVADTPDVDQEIGKVVTNRGKSEGNSAKARDKMENAEVAWQSATATATALAP